jgi:hypothetical protein
MALELSMQIGSVPEERAADCAIGCLERTEAGRVRAV